MCIGGTGCARRRSGSGVGVKVVEGFGIVGHAGVAMAIVEIARVAAAVSAAAVVAATAVGVV